MAAVAVAAAVAAVAAAVAVAVVIGRGADDVDQSPSGFEGH